MHHDELRRHATRIFRRSLDAMNAERAVRSALERDGERLRVWNADYDLGVSPKVYVVAFGKAAGGMASAACDAIGDVIAAGVLSAPAEMLAEFAPAAASVWRTYAGGHPVPNRASLDAGGAALEMIDAANRDDALVIFLVSGGGSAMFESPINSSITLDDLRRSNEAFVACGATIDEINFLRRRISAVKGGRLAARAPRARQLTLVVSDTNPGAAHAVASGPSVELWGDESETIYDPAILVRDYDLEARLPAVVLRALVGADAEGNSARDSLVGARNLAAREASGAVFRLAAREVNPRRKMIVLLDQNVLLAYAAHTARAHGFETEIADDLVEQPIAEGAASLVARLARLRARVPSSRSVCLLSAGEFRCPVRGAGRGGRNSETILRCLLEAERREARHGFAILCGGTDGIDGNSPAAGATGDDETLTRARARSLDPEDHLARSDSHTFFVALGDDLITGATGTNVRDLRVLLA